MTEPNRVLNPGAPAVRRIAPSERADVVASEWTARDWIALTATTVVAGVLRLIDLGDPRKLMFDELFYARDACVYASLPEQTCRLDAIANDIHPPLGKWLIAWGIDLFGYSAFGWRIAAAIAGILSVAVVYLLGRKILRSTLGASVGAGLLAVDFLHFVQSRIAMLDIFMTLFGLAAILFVAYDRDRLWDPLRTGAVHEAATRFRRPWRAAVGAAAGAAVASKWPGAVFVVAVIVLTVAWETHARRADGKGQAFLRTLQEESASIFVYLIVLPSLVYMASYIGQLDGDVLALPWSENSWFNAFFRRQFAMFAQHREISATHSYQSNPWTWLALKRPVAYYFRETASGGHDEVIALGNPFVWWLSVVALAYVTLRWLRRRDPSGPEGTIVAGFAWTYLPWVALAAISTRSAMFLFYLLPSVPFMCLALGYVATRIAGTWEGRAAMAIVAAAAVGLFFFYFPLLASNPIPRSHWEQRIWIFGDEGGCAKPEVVGGEEARDKLPPKGWCWI